MGFMTEIDKARAIRRRYTDLAASLSNKIGMIIGDDKYKVVLDDAGVFPVHNATYNWTLAIQNICWFDADGIRRSGHFFMIFNKKKNDNFYLFNHGDCVISVPPESEWDLILSEIKRMAHD